MNWSFNNPDLKPIENYWAIIKRNMKLYGLKNFSKLKSFLNEE